MKTYSLASLGLRFRALVGLPLAGRPLRLSCASRVGSAPSAGPSVPARLSVLSTFIFTLALTFSSTAHAQWQTPTYTLLGGWNSIYLHGDATHATLDQLFAANPEIIEVWRWNPNPNQTQYQSSPLIPSAGTPEWSIWTRGQPTQSTLASLVGRSAYLVRCTGTVSNTYSLALAQKILPPGSTWVRNGANFFGFPSRLAGSYPTLSSYFATFPAAIAANSRIYKYVGGELGAANPVQVFSTATEPLDRTRAYWFEAPVVSNFYAPVEIAPSQLDGLHYGRTGALLKVILRNLSAAAVTITVAPTASSAVPTGQTPILGAVPLKLRTLNAATATYTETPIVSAFNQVVGPQSSVELSFTVDRAQMPGTSGALYASFLRFTDAGNLLDVSLPASAVVSSLAGLWIGDVSVSNVQSKAGGTGGTTTVRPFPLRVLLHVDDAGTARLLSQVFLGRLAPSPYAIGLCTRESALKQDDRANASRFSAVHLPPDTEIASGSGSVALGATLVRTVPLPFNAPTNPFVHAYHPDHDNKDARFAPLAANSITGASAESPAVNRVLSFSFATTAPPNSSSIGWGSTVLGGTFSETVTGIHKAALTVSGTFELRRISEIGAITTN